MAAGNYKIPYHPLSGDVQHFPEPAYKPVMGGHTRVEPDWRENTPFEDTLMFHEFRRGRSAAYAEFWRLNGTKVPVFLTDLCAMVPLMTRGAITGSFMGTKRGMNYGVKLYMEKQ